MSSQSSVSFTVDCLPGFDGGAPQVLIKMMIMMMRMMMIMMMMVMMTVTTMMITNVQIFLQAFKLEVVEVDGNTSQVKSH